MDHQAAEVRSDLTTAHLMRMCVWESTPLGAPGLWPQPLRTVTAITLGSRQPMFVAWGPKRVLIYNDAYAPLLGSRHPAAFGRPFFEVWPEVNVEVGALMDQVFAGVPVHMDDITLMVERHGYPEEAHFSFSYTPVPDDDESVGGLFCACMETTAAILAHRRMTEARERQRLLLEQMPGFVAMLVGSDHVYEYVNAAYIEIAGHRDFIGNPVRAVFPDLEGQGFFELLDEVYATGRPFTAQAMPIRLAEDQSDRFIDLTYHAIRDEAGLVTGIFVGGYEVTERLKAVRALTQSEARFRAVAETIPGFVWTADAEGALDYTSPHWHVYSGSDPHDSQGQGWSLFVHEDDRAVAFARWAESLMTKAHYEMEFRLRRADGCYRWWLARARPTAEAATGTRWIGVCIDIDDIVAARETLSRSRAELERLVGERTRERDRVWTNARDLMVVIDTGGIFHAVSPAWRNVLGHDPASVVGRSFRDFVHPDDSEISEGGHVEAVARRDLTNFENRYLHTSGTPRWISWHTSKEGDLVYAYGRDITAEKQQAEALLLVEEQLRQAQKMEAVGQLTGGIAHDFNNMLSVVIGSLDLLGRRIEAADQRSRRYVDQAMDGARRAALLTQRLLAFSRQQPLRPETIDANRLVAGMSDILRHVLGGAVRLETVLAGGLWSSHADQNQLENVVLNLAVNARDAMPDGGRLTIETQNAHLDARYVTAHPDLSAGQYVMIAVSDTGTGMSADVIAKAFDPFFTTKEVGKGTGLGLSQVYGFIKQSGGHVKIYSEAGQGTTVKIYMPRFFSTTATPVAVEAESDLPLGDRHELVLVVEDEPAVRRFSIDALAELGYRTLEADGAVAAMRHLEAHPEIVLLFTDVVMPEVNGRKLADAAKRLRPELKILFTTGYTRNAVVHNGVLDPGVELLGKPFTLEDLATKIRAVLDRPAS